MNLPIHPSNAEGNAAPTRTRSRLALAFSLVAVVVVLATLHLLRSAG